MKRRAFLKMSSLGSVPLVLGGWQIRALVRSPLLNLIDGDNDRVLVLIQLNGGNDGLNTLIPLDQYDRLAQARSNLLLPENHLLEIDQELAFHPDMIGLEEVYQNEHLHIVQGVAYPNQNRSHFRSTDIWTSGSSSEEELSTGWLGRYFYGDYPQYPDAYPNAEEPDPFAITIGPLVSETCQGPISNYSLALLDPSLLSPLAEGYGEDPPPGCYGDELTFLREAVRQTNAYSDTITNAIESGDNEVIYQEDNNLAQQLKTVAQLISGGLKTRVYVVSLGGFDTHSAQVESGDPESGKHAELLTNLSDAVKTFQDDLLALGVDERVLGMTFSEFGRQIRSNYSDGTDHGTAAPMFLFGSCVEPMITGDNPDIPEELESQEGVAMQYDFRSVYGSVLMDWFGVSEEDVRTLLFQEFQHLPLIRGCDPTAITDTERQLQKDCLVYPNPVHMTLTVEFTMRDAEMTLALFDTVGHRHRVRHMNRPAGTRQRSTFDVQDVPAGYYVLRVSDRNGQCIQRIQIVH